jgi:catechol 2,3-dioxygenase-like lactoylglutathione lyase family enzyme
MDRKMTTETGDTLGAPPADGWAALVPELLVNDLDASLDFWCDTLGFAIAYRRPAQRFVYLDHHGAQVMLCQRNGRCETGPMQPPLGQGAMFQIYLDDTSDIIARLDAIGWPLYEPLRDVWYRAGDVETGLRQVLVQDPDGYLLMLAQKLGERPVPSR